MVGRTLNICLVNPACQDQRINPEDSLAVPIGIYYIAAVLKANGFNVEVINLAVEHEPDAYFAWIIQKHQPDLIGFSVMSATRMSGIRAARIARQSFTQSTIVFGGPFATFMPEPLLNANPEIDFIVKGEGEITFLELAQSLEEGHPKVTEKIDGLAYRKGGQVIHTATREVIQNLDDLPHPSEYFSFQHLSMSRGCPGKCTFCGSPKFWGHDEVRFHSPAWFADEIQALHQQDVRHFFISDDTFTFDRDRVITLCRELISRDLDITWNAISRVDRLDEEMLVWMRKAGCIQISFGVESGSEVIRRHLGKPVQEEEIIRAFSLCTSLGIMPRAYFIYGSPGETKDTIQESVDLMLRIKPLSAIFYILVLFPGTFLYQRALDKSWINDGIWDENLEDLPWFELDPNLDFERVKSFGDTLRTSFFNNLEQFVSNIDLRDDPSLYRFHSDFLSRLAMTFSHGDYAQNPSVSNTAKIALNLYQKALDYHPDFRAYLGLGMLYMKQKQFKDAILILNRGLEHFKDHEDLTICMALNHMNLGDFALALTFLEPVRNLPKARKYIDICNQKLGAAT